MQPHRTVYQRCECVSSDMCQALCKISTLATAKEEATRSTSLTVHELEGEESQVLGAQVCTGRPEVHREEVPRLDRRGDGTVGAYLAVASLVEVQAAVEEENPCMG